MICIEFQKETLTVLEACKNLKEMRSSLEAEHVEEVEKLIHAEAMKQLDELLKDFDPFVEPPKPVSEPSLVEYVHDKTFDALKLKRYAEKSINPDFYGMIDILPDDDKLSELELEDFYEKKCFKAKRCRGVNGSTSVS